MAIDPDLAEVLATIQDALALALRVQTQGHLLLLQLAARLTAIQATETLQMATFSQVQDEVTKSNSVMDGAVLLLSNLSQLLKDAKNASQNGGDPNATPAALDKIISDLDQRTESLASAIVQNTPVDPNPQPVPVPTTGQINQGVPTGPSPEGTDTPVNPDIAGAATPADVNRDQAINQSQR